MDVKGCFGQSFHLNAHFHPVLRVKKIWQRRLRNFLFLDVSAQLLLGKVPGEKIVRVISSD